MSGGARGDGPRGDLAAEGLAADRVSRRLGGELVLDGVSLTPATGSTVGVLGPNGSGKSTLLRVLAGVLTPTSGVVTVDGRDLGDVGRRTLARRVAVVEQHADTQIPLTVRDVVGLGRVPHRRAWLSASADDEAAVAEALEQTGMTTKGRQRWQTLSGGERQRVQIARALAQRPRELLLDEPTNHLDVQHQFELLDLLTSLPVTSVVALHDLNLAAMYCDDIVVLDHGVVVAAGSPAEVLTEALILQVYSVKAEVTTSPEGHPHVRFIRT
ncbi:histidinol phosphatase [Saccharomonospora sp. CUA-673]|uniref:ABC transporter ATP-binding protein n=1 Tax=Saccharomonospora sp. CUA-673 TaxID=1904969 RepID=UPI00095B19FF|nr:ABC transporter ATP-binding protein [Saccharomonospora sp. CUA-673]OLT46351.1 histidinol phosphatase [Saccharomonospora sp. CUA-673]